MPRWLDSLGNDIKKSRGRPGVDSEAVLVKMGLKRGEAVFEGYDESSTHMAESRRKDRAVVREFIDSIRANDLERFSECLEPLESRGMWCGAMRAVSSEPNVSREFRDGFLRLWIRSGDHIRQEIGDDLILASGLRALLPPYDGPGLRLYRGEGASNRSRRTYGLSWTSDCDIAAAFAQGLVQTSHGGSVLLSATAPREAIICAPALLNDRYQETEYLVGRRLLKNVKVLQRYPQITIEEYRIRKPRMATATSA